MEKSYSKKVFLGIDLGASSGRHIVGYLENGILKTEEVYRFKNIPIINENGFCWDIDMILSEVKKGIAISLQKHPNIETMAVDSWGVDYVLMNDDKVIYPVYGYRNLRTTKVTSLVHSLIDEKQLYEKTGIQFQQFNTIYQLYCDKLEKRLDCASDFLMIPEYINYMLTGIKIKEYTNATTTNLVNAYTKEFDHSIIETLGFNKSLFPKLFNPTTVVGDFKNSIKKEVGGNIKVVLCASHDTASAVNGIPMEDDEIYISSGTWSLLGVKSNCPIITDEGKKNNYSNEGGINYYRFQKNIVGMWFVEKLIENTKISLEHLLSESSNSQYSHIFDIYDDSFTCPDNMKEAIRKWYCLHGIETPVTNGDYGKAIFTSIAYYYSEAIKELESITSKVYKKIYIVGGGAKNEFVNASTKYFSKKEVIALPIESTAIGNLKVQVGKVDL